MKYTEQPDEYSHPLLVQMQNAIHRTIATKTEKTLLELFDSGATLQAVHSQVQTEIRTLRSAGAKERDVLHPLVLKRVAKALAMKR